MSPAGAPAPRIDQDAWAGGREPMLRFGPEDAATTVIVALPLLEEANRTRALAAAMLRRLAARGLAGALPELPGTGESAGPTEAMRLADLRAAFAAAGERVDGRVMPVAIRSASLLVTPDLIRGPASSLQGDEGSGTPAQGRGDVSLWMLSPQSGAEVVREWRRLRDAGDGVTVAGNRIASALWKDLDDAAPPPARVVRLQGDPRPADRIVAAAPPWRRAEPDADLALADILADDVADWIARCRG